MHLGNARPQEEERRRARERSLSVSKQASLDETEEQFRAALDIANSHIESNGEAYGSVGSLEIETEIQTARLQVILEVGLPARI